MNRHRMWLQIRRMCVESDNSWFLSHDIPQKALKTLGSEWVISEINGKLAGFMLTTENGHYIYFALVKEKYRRQGVLKSMVASVYRKLQGHIELDSLYEEEHIWKKLGFVWNGTMNGAMHRLIVDGIQSKDKDKILLY